MTVQYNCTQYNCTVQTVHILSSVKTCDQKNEDDLPSNSAPKSYWRSHHHKVVGHMTSYCHTPPWIRAVKYVISVLVSRGFSLLNEVLSLFSDSFILYSVLTMSSWLVLDDISWGCSSPDSVVSGSLTSSLSTSSRLLLVMSSLGEPAVLTVVAI